VGTPAGAPSAKLTGQLRTPGEHHAAMQLGTRATVEIAVIDNGPGIPASKMGWIFEPFNTTKGAKGTGLGLAVAKRVAEEHGGAIFLDSVEGKGATFRMLIPADLNPVNDPSATAASRQSMGGSPQGPGLSGESVRPR
jgi:signal transduction histidine kinase